MSEAKTGDTVKVHYRGILENGEVFYESYGKEALEFTIGEGGVIPGFEEVVVGMTPGDVATEKVPCEKAFGHWRDDLVAPIEREELPEGVKPVEGQYLVLRQKDGRKLTVLVTDQDEATVTFDGNHPLAGRDITFEIELVEIT